MMTMTYFSLSLSAQTSVNVNYEKARFAPAMRWVCPEIEIDNMGTPLIYIATGQNEQMANEIAAVFEYIMRHQQSNKTARSQKSKVVTKRTRR